MYHIVIKKKKKHIRVCMVNNLTNYCSLEPLFKKTKHFFTLVNNARFLSVDVIV